ncbi:MAG TPA: hypothetical protein PK509_12055 [Catalimonadaceae bacterium]|nr:hypothetical protein [Catalimonadaceae bacterium]HPI10427.1 hypothetical protein [Catalimonadaceae bacterium]
MNNRPPFRKRIFFPILFLGLGLAMAALLMLLWNAILPELFRFPVLSYGQALGLLIICRILFGSFRMGPGGGGFGKPGFQERFRNLSEEDREKMRQRWKEKCGPGPQ